MREINFDLDGTIADLYGVDGWLDYILAEDETPYVVAKPLINLSSFARIINNLQKKRNYCINIISWLSKGGDENYHKRITIAKINWLKEHLPSVKWNKISIVAYGTPKSSCGNGILFDDEENNRKEWNGVAYDVDNILEILKHLE